MTTTSMSMARRAVEILQEQGVAVALLHGRDRWEQGTVSSDVDLVVDRPVSTFGPAFFPALMLAECFPIVVWNYELGASSIFIVDAACIEGVQIDLNYDARGDGPYGLRSGAVLERTRSGTSPPYVNEIDEWLYSTRKRLVKRQDDRARELLARRPDTAENLEQRGSEIFTPAAARSVSVAIRTGQLPVHRSSPRVATYQRRAARAVTRVRQPAGYWVDLLGAPNDVARACAEIDRRFARILPRVEILNGAGVRQVGSILRGLITRLRPGLVISSGMRRSCTPIDLFLEVDVALERAAETLVRAMAARYA